MIAIACGVVGSGFLRYACTRMYTPFRESHEALATDDFPARRHAGMKKTVISANCVVGMAVLSLPVFLLFVTYTFAAACLRLIASLKLHNLLGSQPALQCAVRFTIQVQNLTIKYQNTAYLEKTVDFISLFCYIETTSQAGTAARYFAANPPTPTSL